MKKTAEVRKKLIKETDYNDRNHKLWSIDQSEF